MFKHISALPEGDDKRGLALIPELAEFRGFTAEVLTHVSQLGVGVWDACGIAAMLMMLRDCGLATSATVNYWSLRIDPGQDGTTVGNLKDMAIQLGGHPEVGAAVAGPFIELVRYNTLPSEFQNPSYRGQTFLHWIVREGDYYYDPLQPLGKGGPFLAPNGQLDLIDVDPTSRVGLTDVRILELVAHDGVAYEMDITALSWRVRKTASPTGETLGVVTKGQRVHVLGTTVVNGIRYDAVQRSAGGADISALDEATLTTGDKEVAYLKEGSGTHVTTPPVNPNPPPVVKSKHVLGVNTINDGRAAEDAISRGCKAVLVCDAALFAFQLATAHPDILVFHRKIALPRVGTAAELLKAIEFSTTSRYPSNLVIVGFNESDTWGQGIRVRSKVKRKTRTINYEQNVQRYIDYEEGKRAGVIRADMPTQKLSLAAARDLEVRLRVDRECNRIVRGQGAQYASGCWSMGTPTLENLDVQHIFQAEAAEALNNEGMIYDYHSYSPRVNFYELDPVWWTGRPRKWLAACGVDLSKVRITSTETGVDQGGVGGFPANHATQDQFLKWCADYLAYQNAPVTVNGVQYPSPHIASMFFQYGQATSWLGYDVRGFADALTNTYWRATA